MNILISGMTCSGKTTLAQNITSECGEHVFTLSQDSYFKDRNDLPRNENNYFLFDNPDAFNIQEFRSNVKKIFNDGYGRFPIYDVNRNKRIDYTVSLPLQEINVFEGLHTIDLLENEVENPIKIYIDTDTHECLRRRIKRDIHYGLSEKEIITYFNEIMMPQYEKYIYPQINNSDFIIKNKEDKEIVLDLIRRYSCH